MKNNQWENRNLKCGSWNFKSISWSEELIKSKSRLVGTNSPQAQGEKQGDGKFVKMVESHGGESLHSSICSIEVTKEEKREHRWDDYKEKVE